MNLGVRRIGVLLAVPPLTFVAFCQGGAVRFTLDNQSDQVVYVSAFYENCPESPGNKQDYYLHDDMVRPGERLLISKDSPGAPHDVKCVLATDSSRRLVLSEPYNASATYVVSQATPIQADPLPAFDQLPSQPWLERQREDFDEDPAGYIVSAVVIVGFFILLSVGLLIALVCGIVYLVRQRRSANESTST